MIDTLIRFSKNYLEKPLDIKIEWMSALDKNSITYAQIKASETAEGEVSGFYDSDNMSTYIKPEVDAKTITGYLLKNKVVLEPFTFEEGEQYFYILLHEIGHVLFKEPFSDEEKLTLKEILDESSSLSGMERIELIAPISNACTIREHETIDPWAFDELLSRRSEIRELIVAIEPRA